MKIRTLLGLALIGGAYYAHKKRGGELTVESVRDSLEALAAKLEEVVALVKDKAREATHEVETEAHEVEQHAADEIDTAVQTTGESPDRSTSGRYQR